LDVPIGLVQTGTFTFQYQLYDDNPDLNPFANPVGEIESVESGFQITAVDAVPEPGSLILIMSGLGVALCVCRMQLPRGYKGRSI
jgi:hypothetical protein